MSLSPLPTNRSPKERGMVPEHFASFLGIIANARNQMEQELYYFRIVLIEGFNLLVGEAGSGCRCGLNPTMCETLMSYGSQFFYDGLVTATLGIVID